jgi:Tfp pilus assembly protein PilF
MPAVMFLTLLCLVVAGGCVRGPEKSESVAPMRVSEMIGDSDPARRASIRLVLQGLEADENFERERARGSYERAVQVDPTNPFAYLALARHELDGRNAEGAMELIDQAAALFEAEGLRNDRVGALLVGLRGRAYQSTGRGEDGNLYLERARVLAPDVWSDGYLSPAEMR